jgi:DNA adenine methylase
MIKSPLRYPGGKSKAVKIIAPLIESTFSEFREPFLGGGSVFLFLKQNYPERSYWINDLYYELYCFWNECQENLSQVISQISHWRDSYMNGKELHSFLTNNISTFNSLQKASAFFVLNRITFSGTSESGGFSQQAFEKRFTQSSIFRLQNLQYVLNDTRITNLDYKDVVTTEGNNVFIFLDPPYFSSTKSALYGKNGNMHKFFDHEEFAHVMRHCPHNWLITYDDSEYIRSLFSFANLVSWDLNYGMRNVNQQGNNIGKELFISNYDIHALERSQYSFNYKEDQSL